LEIISNKTNALTRVEISTNPFDLG